MKRTSPVWSSTIVVAVLLAGLALSACGSSTPSTTSTTSTSTTLLQHQPVQAIWPFYNSGVRYITPEAAVSSFATQYVAMTAPLIGTFTSNGVSTGVVEVRSQAGGPVTSVNVAEVTGDGTWWVLSASTPQIIVTVPANLDTVLSPIAMSGQSTAFEAVVNVTVRADGSLAPLATNTVMGGSMGAMGPFAKSIPFAVTAATDGAVMFREISPRDSRYIEATVVRVHF